MAEAYRMLKEPGKAISCYQRGYMLYGAYHDLVIDAYSESARLFENHDNLAAAAATLVELLGNDDLRIFQGYSRAKGDLARIQSLIAAKPPFDFAQGPDPGPDTPGGGRATKTNPEKK